MPERELERVMRDFVAQRYNLLLCSTIIETGIDVPTANTIVMSRADKFGLAQLHQLRGRVGRSHHQAYAYLMVPDMEGLTKQAQQRLDAIQAMEELGSGFYLAMHDLEIRGAGEVLGENQSGNMLEVGFQLYNEMLAEAVRCLKAGKEPDLLAPLSSPPTSTCTPPPCCPTTTAATCICACRSTRSWPRPRPPSRSTRCWRKSSTASASCRRRPRR
jgi:transcription-repair coupling factor (superfamily II helicase)